jgi:hypothetical protein
MSQVLRRYWQAFMNINVTQIRRADGFGKLAILARNQQLYAGPQRSELRPRLIAWSIKIRQPRATRFAAAAVDAGTRRQKSTAQLQIVRNHVCGSMPSKAHRPSTWSTASVVEATRPRLRVTAETTRSHDQVVRHIGNEGTIHMVRNDTEVVGGVVPHQGQFNGLCSA